MVELRGRRVVLVGAGRVGTRRLPALLAAGADVLVVDPDPAALGRAVAAAAAAGAAVVTAERGWLPADCDGAWLVLACTDDPAANAAVSAAAADRRVLCVRADDGPAGTATVMAAATEDGVTVAVSAGRDPRRAAALRDGVAAALRAGLLPLRRGRRGEGPGSVTFLPDAPHRDDEALPVATARAVAAADLLVAAREVLGRAPDPVASPAALAGAAAEGARVVRLVPGDPATLAAAEVDACRAAGVTVSLPDPPAAGERAPAAVVLIAHGSGDADAVQAVRDQAALVAGALPGVAVRLGFVDHADPSAAAVLDGLVTGPGAVPALRDGTATAVVLPYLLAAASHSKTDIAGSVQAARLRHPGLRLRYGRPLGAHPDLLALGARRVREAGVDPAAPGVAVVVASAGTADPDANAEQVRMARLLAEYLGCAVEAAFASATGPTPGQAAARLARDGARTVAVVPWVLAPGHFARQVEASAQAGIEGTGAQLVLTAALGPDDAVTRLVADRVAEAWQGDIRMNCDVCQYRTPYPGREARLGAPQRPHAHPTDVADPAG
jgi:sirohydrochlorin cobaltochelatase